MMLHVTISLNDTNKLSKSIGAWVAEWQRWLTYDYKPNTIDVVCAPISTSSLYGVSPLSLL
jgi:hypothetical protein